jgi:hypothetical protein
VGLAASLNTLVGLRAAARCTAKKGGGGRHACPPQIMAYAPKQHVRFAHFGRSLVVLDIEADSFLLIDDVDSNDLIDVFETPSHPGNNLLQESLIETGLITESAVAASRIIEFQPRDFFEARAVNERYDGKLGVKGFALASLAVLSSALLIKFFGFRVLSYFETKKDSAKRRQSDRDVAVETSGKIGRVFALFGSPWMCLGHSVSLWLALKTQRISSKICIGVRSRPLLSHAWVELDGYILNGDKNLRHQLSVIWEVE